MLKARLLALAAASFVFTSHAASFADAVVSYDPGVGFAPRFTNPVAALGAPSQVNPFGEPTDPFDPPVFVSLMPMRKTVPNGADYGGIEIAKQQQKAYPDIKSLVVKSSPADTMQKAIDAARSMGWEIVASDAPAGRIEATDTTTWFGFKDDIIVRVRPEASGGSRVDVRSVSRLGESDVGANAKRVRKYLAKLA